MKTVTLTLDGVTFKVAPTPMADLAEVSDGIIDAAKGRFSRQTVDAITAAVFAGARRVKSEITLEWLRSNTDVTTFPEVVQAFLEVNGFKKPEPAAEGAGAPGEAPAASTG